jgi:hypothetical protein
MGASARWLAIPGRARYPPALRQQEAELFSRRRWQACQHGLQIRPRPDCQPLARRAADCPGPTGAAVKFDRPARRPRMLPLIQLDHRGDPAWLGRDL